ncbi:hypothetical protein M3Y99_00911400 [Aphelenchoides fujianensis]|nr:hypothetical protein M3Y99_00911400 [Aphelenchoides fujianensis]
MTAACKHSALLSSFYSVKYEGVDVQSPKGELPFRPGTKFSLVLMKSPSVEQSVRIAVEGSTEGLKGAVWILDEDGGYLAFPLNVQLNTNSWFCIPLNSRVFCKLDQLEARVFELQQPTENSLRSRIQELQKEAADKERKLAAALHENDARMAKNTVLASTIQSLEAKLGERKKAAKEAADRETALVEHQAVLEKENETLKSSLSNEQTRSATLRRQLDEHEKAARESKKEAIERERTLAAVQQENAAVKQEEKKLASEIAELTAALEDQKQAEEAVAAENLAVANENAALLSKVVRLESVVEERKNEAKALAEQRSGLEHRIEELKCTLFNEQTRAFSLQRELKRQVDELKKNVRVLEEAAIERESKLTAVRQEDDTFTAESKQLVAVIAGLSAALARRQEAGEAAVAKSAALEKKNAELKRQKETLISKLAHLEQRTDNGDSKLLPALQSPNDCCDSSLFSELQPLESK